MTPILGIIASSKKGFTVSGGNEIGTVGAYRYHFFTGNGNLEVIGAGTIEITGVGGGGAGGYNNGAGGGAG